MQLQCYAIDEYFNNKKIHRDTQTNTHSYTEIHTKNT